MSKFCDWQKHMWKWREIVKPETQNRTLEQTGLELNRPVCADETGTAGRWPGPIANNSPSGFQVEDWPNSQGEDCSCGKTRCNGPVQVETLKQIRSGGLEQLLRLCFTVIWIIPLAIPLEVIFGVHNALLCTILITCAWATVNSSVLANIQFLSTSSSEVLCRQSSRQWWSFKWSKCSSTFMWGEWPAFFHNHFHIGNLSSGGNLLVLWLTFLWCITYV